MRKVWVMALKEIMVTFRDTGALLLMLVTPLVLTLTIAAAFGTGSGRPISGIQVLLLDRDGGQMSRALVDAFYSERVGDLVLPEMVANSHADEAAARERVHADELAALVVIPEGFTARLLPLGEGAPSSGGAGEPLTPEQMQALGESLQAQIEADPVVIEIYASPQYRISTAVIRAIISQVLEEMNLATRGIPAAVTRLAMAEGSASEGAESLYRLGFAMGERMATGGIGERSVRLVPVSAGGRAFNWLDYMASSMAILFLMFAVTSGGRSLFTERQAGTLPRLLITPTRSMSVLVGKMAGIMLVGTLQVIILWRATTILGAYWGGPLPVMVSIVLLVMCATGVAALIAAWAKSAAQAGALGTGITLVAAASSGAFLPRMNLPAWMQQLSLVTPNAWGIDIFTALQSGRGLADIAPLLAGVVGLTAAYYLIAAVGFRRQYS
jgi:ABC-type Na+ efflux pump permease subunit